MTVTETKPKLEYKKCNFVLLETTPEDQQKALEEKARGLAVLDETTVLFTPPEFESVTHGRLLRGYASTWDIDTTDDEIDEKAFDATIELRFKEWIKIFGGPFIKVLEDHGQLVGILHNIRADKRGVYVEFWCLNTQAGREFYIKVVSRAINQMSFGFMPLVTEEVERMINGVMRTIRRILRLDCFEVSGVRWPANEETELDGKATAPELKDRHDGLEEETMSWTEFCEKVCKDCGQQVNTKAALTAEEQTKTREAIAALIDVVAHCSKATEVTTTEDASTEEKATPVTQEKTLDIPALETPPVVPTVEDNSDPKQAEAMVEKLRELHLSSKSLLAGVSNLGQ